MVTARTFYKIPLIGPPMVMPTNRTAKTVRPPLNKKIISASFLSTEPCVELYQIPWKIWESIGLHPLYFKEHGNMSQVEKPIIEISEWERNMNKTATIKKQKLFADFERLSKKRKKEVADFVAYLKVKEELEATKEILRDKDFLNSIMRGDEDFKAGRFKSWSEVKENV